MARVILNDSLPADEVAWQAQNGATRTTLIVINKTGREIPALLPVNVKIGFLKKGNHRFIFINNPPNNNQDDRLFFIILDGYSYGYTIEKNIKTIFEDMSVGGPGNSRSQFGIYQLENENEEGIIKFHTYKHRRDPSYRILSAHEPYIQYLSHTEYVARCDDNNIQEV